MLLFSQGHLFCAENKDNVCICYHIYLKFGKCPKILYTKVSDKMAYANCADLDQTAPSGAV